MTQYLISELKPHPENKAIYGEVALEPEFVDSVRRMGVLTPLLVTFDNRIISGHRRWLAAQKTNLLSVEGVTFPSHDELDILEALIESNRQRQKTNEQMGREAARLFEVERERAANRRRATQNNDTGRAVLEHVPELSEAGNSRDKVGASLGYSGKHVEKAAAVVGAIDTLSDNGKRREAEQLRTLLNQQSVSKAYQTAIEHGHIRVAPRPVSVPKQAEFITLEEWQTLNEAEQFQAIHSAVPRGKFNFEEWNNIEWALWSWNPITGCLHNCDYCYARDIAERFYPQKFAPSLVPSRLGIPASMTVPPEAQQNIGYKNVFTCSMADLFGKWVPREWIDAVLEQVRAAPDWNFLFLTKFPIRMAEFDFPSNAWVGTTVDRQYAVERAEKAFKHITAAVKFLSCEPLLEPLRFTSLDMFDWVIVGGSSKSTQTPEFRPPRQWINDLEDQARAAGCKVYEKTNLLERIREYPGAE